MPTVREVHILTASQSGKTEGLLNLIGKRFHWGPRTPALYVAPTQDLARSISSERVEGMLRVTPELLELWHQGQRDHIEERFIAGVRLGFAWAGSKSQLASRPAGLVIVDELDRMVADAGGEGSPLRIVGARLKNFARGLLVSASTPTITGASAGFDAWASGSRELWTWRCLDCGELFVPWSRFLRWAPGARGDDAAGTARLVCPHCGVEVTDADKGMIERSGLYVPQAIQDGGDLVPDPERTPAGAVRSFWVPGLASPWVRFSDLARQLSNAYGTRNPAEIQPIVNTWAGELFALDGDAPDHDELAQLQAQQLRRGQAPSWAQRLTAGVDVQQDRLYWTARGWGPKGQTHTVEYGELFGDPMFDDVWMALARALADVADATGLDLVRAFVDSGYKPGRDSRAEHSVYRACRRNATWFPTKGYNNQGKPMSSSLIDVTLDGGRVIRGGLRLWRLQAPYWKGHLYGRIRWPAGQAEGRWTLPGDADPDYLAQLVAEQLITLPSGRIRMHTPRGHDDHYGDCEALATAAGYSLRLEQLTTPRPSDAPPRARAAPDRLPAHLQRRGLS